MNSNMAREIMLLKPVQHICARKQKCGSKMHNIKIMKTIKPANRNLPMKTVKF